MFSKYDRKQGRGSRARTKGRWLGGLPLSWLNATLWLGMVTGVGLLVPTPTAAQSGVPARRPRLARPPSCSTAEELRQLQRSLQARGLYQGRLSGRLDRSTRAAIAQYQKIVGLPATSRPDVATCRHLLTTSPSAGSRSAPPPDSSVPETSLPPTIWASLADRPAGLPEKSRAGLAKVGGDLSHGSHKLSETLEHTSQQATTSIIGRPDSRIHRDVRQLLDDDPWTTHWPISIKEGVVTLKVPRKNRLDPAPVVESIRRVAGVKAVFLILF